MDKDTTTGAFKAILGGKDEKIVPTTTGKIRVVAPGRRGSRRSIGAVDSGTFATESAGDITGGTPVAPPPSPEESVDGLRASELNFREVGIKTWKVKVAIGLIYDFSDIATLKKYLGDKKVTADDLISHNNNEWTRIGDIPNLDAHFVATWKEAKHLIATGERPAVKKKARPADQSGAADVDSTLTGSHSAAGTTGATLPTIPGAYGGNKARDRARRKRQKENESSKPPVALLVLAAIIVVGGLFAWKVNPDRILDTGPAKVAVSRVGEVSEAELSDIARKIQEDLDRKGAEVTAGTSDEILKAAEEATSKEKTIAQMLADGTIERVKPPPPGPGTTDKKRQKFILPIAQNRPANRERATPKRAQVVVKTPKGPPHQIYLDMAKQKLAAQNYGSAVKAAESAIKRSPDCVQCWNILGKAYQKLGKPQESAEAFSKAEKLASAAGSSSQAGQ
jgi:cytoskeletal protein RodZ